MRNVRDSRRQGAQGNRGHGTALRLDSHGDIRRIRPGRSERASRGPRRKTVAVRLAGHPVTRSAPDRSLTPKAGVCRYARGPAEDPTVLGGGRHHATNRCCPLEWIVWPRGPLQFIDQAHPRSGRRYPGPCALQRVSDEPAPRGGAGRDCQGHLPNAGRPPDRGHGRQSLSPTGPCVAPEACAKGTSLDTLGCSPQVLITFYCELFRMRSVTEGDVEDVKVQHFDGSLALGAAEGVRVQCAVRYDMLARR